MSDTIQTEPTTESLPDIEHSPDGYPVYLTEEESEQMFEEAVQTYLGISGDEFRRRWETGEYGEYEADHGPTAFLLGTMPPRG